MLNYVNSAATQATRTHITTQEIKNLWHTIVGLLGSHSFQHTLRKKKGFDEFEFWNELES